MVLYTIINLFLRINILNLRKDQKLMIIAPDNSVTGSFFFK